MENLQLNAVRSEHVRTSKVLVVGLHPGLLAAKLTRAFVVDVEFMQ